MNRIWRLQKVMIISNQLVIFLVAVIAMITAVPVKAAEHETHWTYEGKTGPQNWGTLSEEWAVCKNGHNQSPVDIDKTIPGDSKEAKGQFAPEEIQIAESAHAGDVINNGHTIQVNFDDAGSLTIGDRTFQLVQYHFHGPSEHTIHGKHYPMEMHLVHKSADGQLAVIGVLIREGKHNAAFDPVWADLPDSKEEKKQLQHLAVNVEQLLPSERTTYRYQGSLTTPPCSEGVQWIVMTTPIQLSRDQIGAFQKIFHDNSRPVQQLYGRNIVYDTLTEQ